MGAGRPHHLLPQFGDHYRARGAAHPSPSLRDGLRLRRFSWRFNLTLLIFPAANLLPPQVLVPIFRVFRAIPLPVWLSDSGNLLNSYLGLILINTAFQVGFCTFVLSNYMKALPHELYEAAQVDGASVWRQYCRSPCRYADRLWPRWQRSK